MNKASLPKLAISAEKLDVNLTFYFFLKYLLKAGLSDAQILNIIEMCYLFSGSLKTLKHNLLTNIPSKAKKSNELNKQGLKNYQFLTDILAEVQNGDDLKLLVFSLKLLLIKDLLLQEAKIQRASDVEKLKHISPLSLEYDKITVFNPYSTRVNGALLSLAFFDSLKAGVLSQTSDDFLTQLAKEANELVNQGIEPNQIFMLLFNESLNQSITSDSGSDYESRIKSVLLDLGIPGANIQKTHDKVDSSTEFDFFFSWHGKQFGISAKRTLRERYKQFIKTAQMSQIDVMIEITLGTDLTEEKVNAIANHGVYLFVSDEIYQQNQYLKNHAKVFSCNELTLATLENL
ncbi:hypothetical protein [Kingella kingae]|uniref:hypothetical protein n=1 Tax=Kingella kingae TaxID=504 RepID=UPI0025536671|nr:hypothetical protein [Kingella kingae]MDK4623710.1 hypothetical protein [Kingella kingae]MDK4659348.1 hypothetical protein [Kingella kingae]MDK4667580.1 hypothetical protein [Kingella kingae]MDK4685987.1 hypothetical protein [Kingella kingae]